MYGPVEYLGEGAVDDVLKSILAAPTDSQLNLDHYYKRYPTHVDDISKGIIKMISELLRVFCFFSMCCNSR